MRPQALSALALCLVVASSAYSAPKITGANEVKPGGFADLTVEGAGKNVAWTVYPRPIQKKEIAGNLIFTGIPGIEYIADATIIDFDAKTFTKLEHVVIFLGSPGPAPVPPGPGPSPVPPAPVDPLALAIRDAAAKDGFTQLAALAGGFRALDAAVDNRSTGGEIKEASRTILSNSLGLEPGKPVKSPAMFAILSKELAPLDTIFPSDATPASPERKQAAKAIFAKLAAACEGASK